MVNPTPVPSNVPRPQQASSNGSPAPSGPVSSTGVGGVRIKSEPNSSYETQPLGQSSGIPNYGNTVAQQRAAQNLAQKFGSTANVQINQLQAQAGMAVPVPQGQHNVQNIQLPRQMLEQQGREFDEQKRQQQQQQQRQYQTLQQTQQRSAVNASQMDGTDDWNAMVAQRRADALNNEAGKLQADLTIREQVQQMSRNMEGGGLMLPLSERPKYPRSEGLPPNQSSIENSLCSSLVAAQTNTAHLPQHDGPNDSDDDNIKDDPDLEDDEDAINSDLDDPEEDIVDDGEEESQKGQIMLCTYDKVQRVKNKWKCTLKDGTLTTGGRE